MIDIYLCQNEEKTRTEKRKNYVTDHRGPVTTYLYHPLLKKQNKGYKSPCINHKMGIRITTNI